MEARPEKDLLALEAAVVPPMPAYCALADISNAFFSLSVAKSILERT